MSRRTKLTDFKPMQDEVLRLREENARLRAEIGEAGSPPPLGSWRQRPTAAEAKLERVVKIAEDGQSQDALHAFDALLRISRLAAAKEE